MSTAEWMTLTDPKNYEWVVVSSGGILCRVGNPSVNRKKCLSRALQGGNLYILLKRVKRSSIEILLCELMFLFALNHYISL
jgi:hypothetical protein